MRGFIVSERCGPKQPETDRRERERARPPPRAHVLTSTGSRMMLLEKRRPPPPAPPTPAEKTSQLMAEAKRDAADAARAAAEEAKHASVFAGIADGMYLGGTRRAEMQ